MSEKSEKIALITGASRGIGRKIAEKFYEKGYDLYLICRNSIEEMKEIPGHHFKGDVSDHSFISSVFEEIPDIDVLVNNAGISKRGLIQDMTKEEWDEIIGVNLTSIFNTCHFASRLMIRQHSGRIINISSMWGISGASMETAYSASKGGVNFFTRALAKELAPSNIQVNAIACGTIDTDMNNFLSAEERSALTDEIPAGRFGLAEEVADLALYLADSAPAYLTGQIIGLDGGFI